MRMFDQVGGGDHHQRQRACLRLGQPHTGGHLEGVRCAATWLVSVMGTQDIGMAGGLVGDSRDTRLP